MVVHISITSARLRACSKQAVCSLLAAMPPASETWRQRRRQRRQRRQAGASDCHTCSLPPACSRPRAPPYGLQWPRRGAGPLARLLPCLRACRRRERASQRLHDVEVARRHAIVVARWGVGPLRRVLGGSPSAALRRLLHPAEQSPCCLQRLHFRGNINVQCAPQDAQGPLPQPEAPAKAWPARPPRGGAAAGWKPGCRHSPGLDSLRSTATILEAMGW